MAVVVLSPSAAKELDDLPKAVRTLVLGVWERLGHWPQVSGAKPLRGPLAGHYRMRTRDYRVQFYLQGQRITVERIGHRDGFYE